MGLIIPTFKLKCNPYNPTRVVVFGMTKPTGIQYCSMIVGLAVPNVKIKLAGVNFQKLLTKCGVQARVLYNLRHYICFSIKELTKMYLC
jgi:hypothetical protein